MVGCSRSTTISFPLTSLTSSLPSAFLPPTSCNVILMPASPVQQHYGQHNNSVHRNSSSSSRQSSTSSTAAHSASSSPLPYNHCQFIHAMNKYDEDNPTYSVNSHFNSHIHSRVHRLAAQQNHPGSITLPPGYFLRATIDPCPVFGADKTRDER